METCQSKNGKNLLIAVIIANWSKIVESAAGGQGFESRIEFFS